MRAEPSRMESVPLEKRPQRDRCLTLPPCGDIKRNLQPGRASSPECDHAGALTLKFTSGSVRNGFLWHISHPGYSTLL